MFRGSAFKCGPDAPQALVALLRGRETADAAPQAASARWLPDAPARWAAMARLTAGAWVRGHIWAPPAISALCAPGTASAIRAQIRHAASDGVYLPLQEVAAGQWLQRGAPLGEVVAGEGRIIALVSESDVASVRPGQEAWFYDEFAMRPVRGTVTAIDYAALPTIPYPELASVYGGPLRAHGTTQSGLYAAAAVYRVEIKADAMAAQHTRLSGWVQIAGERRTLLDRAWNVLAQSLRREAYLY